MWIEGLRAPKEATTYSERRMWLLSASEEEIASQLESMVLALRTCAPSLAQISSWAGAPVGEIAASPFTLRAVALGVQAGAYCVPHELRALVESDDVDESILDPDHGVWDRGVLMTGKYQSFQHDDPLLTRNPNHMARWTAHEMLHRAGGFFWSPTLHRWELYLASRLNELVPVVHWYTTDSWLRTQHDGFDRVAEGAVREIPDETLDWLNLEIETLRPRIRAGAKVLRAAVEHFEEEIADVAREIATGAVVARARAVGDSARLDASSDAMAYVVGHYARLKAKNVGAVLTHLPEIHAWRDESVSAYLTRTEALFDALLFGTISLDGASIATRRLERERWDVLLRAAHHAETRHGRLRALMNDVVSGSVFGRDALREAMQARLGTAPTEFALCDGSALSLSALEQLENGLRSFAPISVDRWQALGTYEVLVQALVGDDRFHRRVRLDERLDAVVRAHCDEATQALFQWECALAQGAAPDVGAQTLGLDVDEDEIVHSALLVASTAFRRLRVDYDLLAWIDALQEDLQSPPPARLARSYTILVGNWRDELQVIPAPRGVLALLDLLAEGTPMHVSEALLHLEQGEQSIPDLANEWPDDADSWLWDLLAAGVVVARPAISP